MQVVEIANDIEHGARELLQRSVLAARNAGATWGEIGASLGISKQAAQKRFRVGDGRPAVELDANERLLGPVGMADEIDELNLAGRYGWHSIGFGVAHHHVVYSDTQWEHSRVIGSRQVSRFVKRDGWTIVGRAFPYAIFKRNTGIPALPEPDGGAQSAPYGRGLAGPPAAGLPASIWSNSAICRAIVQPAGRGCGGWGARAGNRKRGDPITEASTLTQRFWCPVGGVEEGPRCPSHPCGGPVAGAVLETELIDRLHPRRSQSPRDTPSRPDEPQDMRGPRERCPELLGSRSSRGRRA